MNPLKRLEDRGQAIWLDFLSRPFIANGGLKKLVEEDGLSGVTSNPTIFKKAIAESSDYDVALKVAMTKVNDAKALYEHLAIEDIQAAAKVLEPVYRKTDGADGLVSMEVSPYLADDTDGTIAEARRLWKAIGRENAMIKVPATEAGVPAIRQLIGEGININITLLFSRSVYRQVAEAYLAGLERCAEDRRDLKHLAGAASIFVSRIDVAVDKLIDAHVKKLPAGAHSDALAGLRGKIAVANARLAYQDYKRLFSGPRWRRLADSGARVQRLLWASTGVKNPAYRDVLYVEELIGPDTIDTMPPETMDAFRDHGMVRPSLEENIAAAENMLAMLAQVGISLDAVTAKLVEDGVKSFADSFDALLAAIESKRTVGAGATPRQMAH